MTTYYLIDTKNINGRAVQVSHPAGGATALSANKLLAGNGSTLQWLTTYEIAERRAAAGHDDPSCPACGMGDGEHLPGCPDDPEARQSDEMGGPPEPDGEPRDIDDDSEPFDPYAGQAIIEFDREDY